MLNSSFMVGNYAAVVYNGKIIPRVNRVSLSTGVVDAAWYCTIEQYNPETATDNTFVYLLKSISFNAMGGLQPEITLPESKDDFPACSTNLPWGV